MHNSISSITLYNFEWEKKRKQKLADRNTNLFFCGYDDTVLSQFFCSFQMFRENNTEKRAVQWAFYQAQKLELSINERIVKAAKKRNEKCRNKKKREPN